MRSKNSVQGINHTKLHRELFKIQGHQSDVHKSNFFSCYVPTEVRNTATGLAIHTRERMHIFDSGATLHRMGLASLIWKEKHAFWQTTECSDNQWHCGLRHKRKCLHHKAGHLSLGTFGGSFSVSAHVGRTVLGNLVIPFLGCLLWLSGCSQTQIVTIQWKVDWQRRLWSRSSGGRCYAGLVEAPHGRRERRWCILFDSKGNVSPKEMRRQNFLQTHHPRWSPILEETLWQKTPRVRKESSVRVQEDVAAY